MSCLSLPRTYGWHSNLCSHHHLSPSTITYHLSISTCPSSIILLPLCSNWSTWYYRYIVGNQGSVFVRNKKRFLAFFYITIPSNLDQFFSHMSLPVSKLPNPLKKVLVPLDVGKIFWAIIETYISLMVVVKSDDGNQAYTRRYIQGNVADGFPKTEASAPPNKNSGKNHHEKSFNPIHIKLLSFSKN